MNPSDGAAKIRMIQRSIRCFGCGLAGLIPLVGLPFAVLAMVYYAQAGLLQRRLWNPARPYQRCGLILSALGILGSLAIAAMIYFNMACPGGSGVSYWMGGDD